MRLQERPGNHRFLLYSLRACQIATPRYLRLIQRVIRLHIPRAIRPSTCVEGYSGPPSRSPPARGGARPIPVGLRACRRSSLQLNGGSMGAALVLCAGWFTLTALLARIPQPGKRCHALDILGLVPAALAPGSLPDAVFAVEQRVVLQAVVEASSFERLSFGRAYRGDAGAVLAERDLTRFRFVTTRHGEQSCDSQPLHGVWATRLQHHGSIHYSQLLAPARPLSHRIS